MTERVREKVNKMVVRPSLLFGDSGTDKKTGGPAGDGRIEDAQAVIGSEHDG